MAKKQNDKYIVIKVDDLLEATELSWQIKVAMSAVTAAVATVRRKSGRPKDPQYIVCNQDEPYADRVWQAILDGEDEKTAAG